MSVGTPESVHPSKPVERFGREASRFLKELVEGKPVRVAYEPGAARLDRYGRTLAYLCRESDGLFVNREIIARGCGHAYTKYPFQHMEDFRAAERAAREGRLGLWAEETGTGPTDAKSGVAGSKPTAATSETTVYVTRTGTKYHRDGCRYLAKSAIKTTLGRAEGRYSPCAVCQPPTLAGGGAENAPGVQKTRSRR